MPKTPNPRRGLRGGRRSARAKAGASTQQSSGRAFGQRQVDPIEHPDLDCATGSQGQLDELRSLRKDIERMNQTFEEVLHLIAREAAIAEEKREKDRAVLASAERLRLRSNSLDVGEPRKDSFFPGYSPPLSRGRTGVSEVVVNNHPVFGDAVHDLGNDFNALPKRVHLSSDMKKRNVVRS